MNIPKQIYGHTEECFSPSYISVTCSIDEGDSSTTLIVRGNGIGAGTGEIDLTKEQALELAGSIYNQYGIAS